MAFGPGTINSIGGAVQDLFAADGLRARAAGSRIQAKNYDLASGYAKQNEKFTELSTDIKQAQLDRSITKTLGGISADVAGAGFSEGGSGLDIMRDSASQGALTHAVTGLQGLITEEGYDVQAKTFTNMSEAARMAADADDKAADRANITALIKGASAVASVFTPGGFGDIGEMVKGLNLGSGMMGGGSPTGYGSG